ncbi:unnamed protein product [Leptidea sinapis]|uniref:2-methoxy-6-polyprenyl-1,4-benzoquinol methylase, mitochondrial n=1 Tax=Leptidea sinapis TaxID=189913 RepID=A0A5E4PT89_9NEOP|nr:unnamed protein product [Leptidea sinapis]
MALRKLLLENQLVSQHLRRCRQMCAQAAVKVENVNSTKHTHFGFQTISEEEKTKKVHEVFETVADKYDLMNDVMSFGIHRIWKDIFMQRLAPRPGTKLLDMAGGTGDITFRYINYIKNLNQGVNEKSTNRATQRTPVWRCSGFVPMLKNYHYLMSVGRSIQGTGTWRSFPVLGVQSAAQQYHAVVV